MNIFLSKIAEEILKENEVNQIEIIVPNNRTKLFLKKEIINNIKFTAWMPKITAIQDIFKNNSELVIASEIELIFSLYEIYLKYVNTNESIDDFYYWGEVILNDFDDIDKYIVDAKRIFKNITDIHNIDNEFNEFSTEEIEIIKRFWTNLNYETNNENKTYIHRDKFIEFWEKLFDIYSDLKEKLINNGKVYQGLLYRHFIENLSPKYFDKNEYFIVGFNALNNCEKKLFDFLKKNKKTRFFWNADNYYLSNYEQEAGLFLRELIKKYPQDKSFPIENNITENTREIEIIETPSNIAQLKLIPEILNKWKNADDFLPEKTAIVLADEKTLIPLLYSIPNNFYPYNVSMGYPVKNSASFSFLNYIIELNINAKTEDNNLIFRTKDIINIVNHVFIKNTELLNKSKIETIIEKYRFLVSTTEIIDIFEKEEIFSLIFAPNEKDAISFLNYLICIFDEMMNIIITNDNLKIETEFMYKIKTEIISLYNTLKENKINLNTKIVISLLRNIISKAKIPFEGEALSGIQVMGFIETRNLDFDRVIMISVNEGVFPAKNATQSIIPYGLRKGYGLPSIEFQDSIFAYYFYRLLQNAKEIKIFYSASAGNGEVAEKSRFITQIQNEINSKFNTKIKNSNKGYNIKINQAEKIIIKKTEEELNVLLDKGKNDEYSFYPSQINTYLKCKLQFYFKYIKKIKKTDDFDEDINKNFGTLFHETIKELYTPYIGKEILLKDFENIENNLEKALKKGIEKTFNLKSEREKKDFENKIFVEIVKKYIKILLEYDKKSLPLKIIALEKEYELNDFSIDGKKIKFSGKIDRIDSVNGIYRIIDYKTGSAHKDLFDIDKIFEQDRIYEYDTNAQMLIYSHILFENSEFRKLEICPGVFELKNLSQKDYNFKIGKKSTRINTILEKYDSELDEIIKSKLISIIQEIFNTKKDFIQQDDEKNCKFCDYKNICDRE